MAREVSRMINGVVTGKLDHLETILAELRSLAPLSVERVEREWMVRRAVERDLQVAVETVLDVCHRLVALSQSAPASSGRQALEKCQQLGAIASAQVYKPLVGFRNLVVHRYERVDTAVLVSIVNDHLADLERFRDEVLAYVRRS